MYHGGFQPSVLIRGVKNYIPRGSKIMSEEKDFSVERDQLIKISKPLFYGFTFLAGISLTISPAYAGTLLGVGMISAIAFVSAGLSKSLDGDWQKFMNIVSVLIVLMAVLAGSYVAAMLSFMG
jgi:hypothetical protein